MARDTQRIDALTQTVGYGVQKIVVLILAGAFSAASNAARAQEIVQYVNLFGEKSMILGVGDKIVRLLDLEYPLQKCSPEERFVCLKSDVFTFAVPSAKKWAPQWTYGGARYMVLRQGAMTFNGELLEYQVIRQDWRENTIDYAYSKERGVIAIRAKGGDQLTLSGDCGFAATSTRYCP